MRALAGPATVLEPVSAQTAWLSARTVTQCMRALAGPATVLEPEIMHRSQTADRRFCRTDRAQGVYQT